MQKDAFINATIIATIGFFLFFCIVIFITFFKIKKSKLDSYAQIPLRDENLNKIVKKQQNKKS